MVHVARDFVKDALCLSAHTRSWLSQGCTIDEGEFLGRKYDLQAVAQESHVLLQTALPTVISVGQESLNLLFRLFILLKAIASLVTLKWREVFIPNPVETKRTLQRSQINGLLNRMKLTETTRRHRTENRDLDVGSLWNVTFSTNQMTRQNADG